MADRLRTQIDVQGVPAPCVEAGGHQDGHEAQAQRPVRHPVQERQRQQVESSVHIHPTFSEGLPSLARLLL